LEEAKEFYGRISEDSSVWDKAKKDDENRPKEDRKFRRPGFVVLEFLIEIWKVPRGAAYDMMTMEAGDYYGPNPIFEGYGVFKVIEMRHTDKANYEIRKDQHSSDLRSKKKYQGFKDWLEDLRKEADIQIYQEVPQVNF